MVLDGALDPAIGGEDVAREQAVGFEVALQSFVDDCLDRGDCPLRGSREGALARVSRFLAGVDRRPLKATSGRRVTESLAVLGVVTALYDEESGWPLLRTALGEAFAGDGSTLLMLADFYTDRNASGHYTTNSNDAIYAVNCLDRPTEGDLATVDEHFQVARVHFDARALADKIETEQNDEFALTLLDITLHAAERARWPG